MIEEMKTTLFVIVCLPGEPGGASLPHADALEATSCRRAACRGKTRA